MPHPAVCRHMRARAQQDKVPGHKQPRVYSLPSAVTANSRLWLQRRLERLHCITGLGGLIPGQPEAFITIMETSVRFHLLQAGATVCAQTPARSYHALSFHAGGFLLLRILMCAIRKVAHAALFIRTQVPRQVSLNRKGKRVRTSRCSRSQTGSAGG